MIMNNEKYPHRLPFALKVCFGYEICKINWLLGLKKIAPHFKKITPRLPKKLFSVMEKPQNTPC